METIHSLEIDLDSNNFNILHIMPLGIFILDANYHVVFWNHCMEDWMAISSKEIHSRNLLDFFPELKTPKYQSRLSSIFKGGPPVLFSSQMHRKLFAPRKSGKKERAYNTVVTALQDKASKEYYALFTIEDITPLTYQIGKLKEMKNKALEEVEQRKAAQKELLDMNEILEQVSRTDPLTGISNRRDMIEKLQREVARSLRSKLVFTIIICDVDDFKLFNDNHGHDCGDFVLKETVSIIRKSLRTQDTIARWGGEEFLLLLPETELEGGVKVAEKLQQKIANQKFTFNDSRYSVTMTFGVSAFNGVNYDIDYYIKIADMALLQGKGEGKNCVRYQEAKKRRG